MKLFFYLPGIFLIIATGLPLVRKGAWWIRIFDFPRIQFTILTAFLIALFILRYDATDLWSQLFLWALALCFAYQLYLIFPYTPLARPQALAAKSNRPERRFTLVVSNILMTNRKVDRFLQMVERHHPDILLVIEPDDWWESQLRPLEERYPHTVKYPRDNTYGMLLYSRLPLHDPEVRFIIESDVPSMHTMVQLPSGDRMELHCLHPRPPRPDKMQDSTRRDAELILVGKEVKAAEMPTVVAGDLNDVAWSYTTEIFQKISGLLDPRIGRGFYSTYHARYPFFRWPLDHIFYTEHFKLLKIKRLENIGSDHFPLLVELVYEPKSRHIQQTPGATRSEKSEAQELIRRGLLSVHSRFYTTGSATSSGSDFC